MYSCMRAYLLETLVNWPQDLPKRRHNPPLRQVPKWQDLSLTPRRGRVPWSEGWKGLEEARRRAHEAMGKLKAKPRPRQLGCPIIHLLSHLSPYEPGENPAGKGAAALSLDNVKASAA